MERRLFSTIWVALGTIIFLSAITTYATQQTLIVEAHGSYRYSIFGILVVGIFLLIYSFMTLFYLSSVETDTWYMRLPIPSFIKIPDEDVSLKYIQGLFLTLFFIIPIILNSVFMQKFIHGTAYHRDNSQPKITNLSHFNYVPLCKAMDLPLLCSNGDGVKKNRIWQYGCESDCGTTYIPFWQPSIFLLFNIFVSVVSVFALTGVFISRDKHVITNKIWKKNIKELIPLSVLERNRDLVILPVSQRGMENRKLFDHDVFISYSRADSTDFVTEMLRELDERKIDVWLDSEIMKPGVDIAEAIRIGLLGSRYAIVIFSKSFFEKSWTKAELHFLLKLEEKVGEIIIPIWHKVDEEYIKQHNRRLSLRNSLDSTSGAHEVVQKIYQILEK